MIKNTITIETIKNLLTMELHNQRISYENEAIIESAAEYI